MFLGGINAFMAVSLGAFGAHILKDQLSPEMMAIYRTGFQYHLFHGIGLIVVALVSFHLPESRLILWSGRLMAAGILLFSGSLYVLSLTGFRWPGAVTPLGGTAFIAAWVLLAVAALREK